ncbi:MAG: hypothetical protein WCY93_07435 [Anaerolineaceae bacterium]
MKTLQQILAESPVRINFRTNPYSVNFDDPVINSETLEMWLSENIRRIKKLDTKHNLLEYTKKGSKHTFVHNLNDNMIDAFVVWYPIVSPTKSLTVSSAWRRKSNLFISDPIGYLYFDYLLPKYGSLKSDIRQTPHGEKFWKEKILPRAEKEGLHIGLVNDKILEEWKSPKIPLNDWLREKDAWGTSRRQEDMSFIISKRKF